MTLAVVAGMFAISVWWGRNLVDGDPRILLPAAPFLGYWRPRLGWGVVATVVVAVTALRGLPALAGQARWRTVVLVAWLSSAAWGCALALATDGPARLARPLATRFEYLAVVDQIDSTGAFLRTFTDRIVEYPVHVQGHPPGPVVALRALDVVGLGGARWAALVVIALGASATPAVLLSLRSIAGESTARRALPYLALTPAAMFSVTSMDGAFLGLASWTTALAARASAHVALAAPGPSPSPAPADVLPHGLSDGLPHGPSRRGHRHDVSAVAAGVLAAVLCYCTYAAPLFLLPAVAIALHRRDRRTAVLAGLAGLAVVGAFTAAGFWWLDGLSATHRRYVDTVARFRPWRYFVLADLAVLAAVVGPAAVAGLVALRDRTVRLCTGAALAGVAIADLSGFTKGEVERIWLPFTPWLLVAAVALPEVRWRWARRWPPWLAAQVVVAITLQLTLRSPW